VDGPESKNPVLGHDNEWVKVKVKTEAELYTNIGTPFFIRLKAI
jgi:hypothetical protein